MGAPKFFRGLNLTTWLRFVHEEDVWMLTKRMSDMFTDEETEKRAGIHELPCSASGVNVANLKLQ